MKKIAESTDYDEETRQKAKDMLTRLVWFENGQVFFNISDVQIFVSIGLSILLVLLSEFSLDAFSQPVLTVAKWGCNLWIIFEFEQIIVLLVG